MSFEKCGDIFRGSRVNRDADNLDVAVSEFLSEVVELRKGLDTGPAPDRPEVEQDDVSLEIGPIEPGFPI